MTIIKGIVEYIAMLCGFLTADIDPVAGSYQAMGLLDN